MGFVRVYNTLVRGVQLDTLAVLIETFYATSIKEAAVAKHKVFPHIVVVVVDIYEGMYLSHYRK